MIFDCPIMYGFIKKPTINKHIETIDYERINR